MKTIERPLVSPLPEKGKKEREDIRRSFFVDLERDIAEKKAMLLLAREGGAEYRSLKADLQALYHIKENHGKD